MDPSRKSYFFMRTVSYIRVWQCNSDGTRGNMRDFTYTCMWFLQRLASRRFDNHSEVKAQPEQRVPFSIPTTVVLVGHTLAFRFEKSSDHRVNTVFVPNLFIYIVYRTFIFIFSVFPRLCGKRNFSYGMMINR